ncbi:hypothetical protein HHK36_024901 [Tetracentron sinense]|uniref:Uncharacterized protein n=1 Tax=Tetracentron sinense TaxID=13715 RepID=A0A834YNX2_TETSI|nr:hypothetical protein HHK36_024901 [Tetracentron sinense]
MSGGRRVVRGSVRMKVRRLQRLVPGGRGLQPDRLFLRTADYILHLRLQVNVLQALSKLSKHALGFMVLDGVLLDYGTRLNNS